MTPEQEAAIRERHIRREGTPFCLVDRQRWPCDTAIVLAALDEARADLAGVSDIAGVLTIMVKAAREDADRLAEALGEMRHDYHQTGSVRDHWADQTGKVGDKPVPIDTCGDMLCAAARDALAAHKALKP